MGRPFFTGSLILKESEDRIVVWLSFFERKRGRKLFTKCPHNVRVFCFEMVLKVLTQIQVTDLKR